MTHGLATIAPTMHQPTLLGKSHIDRSDAFYNIQELERLAWRKGDGLSHLVSPLPPALLAAE